MTFKKDLIIGEVDKELCRLESMLRRIEVLNIKCEQNAKNLNIMMLELKGLVAMVRPNAKKNAWYGEEFEGKVDPINKSGIKYISEKTRAYQDNIKIEIK